MIANLGSLRAAARPHWQPKSGTPVHLKVIVYNARGRIKGKNVYVKFYHSYRKHKTHSSANSLDPTWNEYFDVFHIIDRHAHSFTAEVWSKNLLGKELRGSCLLYLAPILGGNELFVDKFYTLEGVDAELRIKVVNMDALPPLDNTVAARAALETLECNDPDGTLAALVDELKTAFPTVPYHTIVSMARSQFWSREKTMLALGNMGAIEITAAVTRSKAVNLQRDSLADVPTVVTRIQSSGAAHESHFMLQQKKKVTQIVAMLPEIDEAEVLQTLENSNWDLCRAVDELILIHRAVIPPTDQEHLAEIETGADHGGFMAHQSQGQSKFIHSSMVRPGTKSVGKDLFGARKAMFEKNQRSKPILPSNAT